MTDMTYMYMESSAQVPCSFVVHHLTDCGFECCQDSSWCCSYFNQFELVITGKGDMVAQWLARWTPDQEVWVQALARSLCSVLEKDTSLSQCLSPPGSINWYQQTIRKPDGILGGYLQWISIPSRRCTLLVASS